MAPPARLSTVLVVLATIALALPSVAPAEAAAGSAAERPDATLEDRTRRFLDGLEAKRAEVAKLERELDDATGEDVDVLSARIAEIRLDMLSGLDALCDAILQAGTDGTDTSAARRVVEPLLREAHETLLRLLEDLSERAGELRARLAGADSGTRLEIYGDLAQIEDRIDRLVVLLFDNVERIERMGVPVDDARSEVVERATRLADDLAARIQVVRERAEELRQGLAASPDSAELKVEKSDADRRLDRLVASLGALIRPLGEAGVETASYQTVLIETTGDVASGLLDKDVVLTLFDQWRERTTSWLLDSGPGLALRLIVVVLILVLFRILGTITRRTLRRVFASARVRTSQLLEDTVVSLASRAVFLLGVLVALSQLGVSLGPILAGLGVAGFIVGFALQDTLSNFAAGGMILFYRPFDVGDMVEAAGVFGKVERMSLVSTTLLTIDHQTLIVPNSKIWGDVIRNVTAQKIRRVDLEFGISYGDDIPHAERVLESILTEHPKVLDEPAPMIRVHRLGESSVDFVVRPWCKTEDYWDVHWDVTREVKMRFDREGVSIPFPQRDVHVKPSGGEAALAATDAGD